MKDFDNNNGIDEEEKQDLLDVLLDKDNKQPITLIDQNGRAIDFEQVAIVPYKVEEVDLLYVVLKPLDKIPGIADDEAVVFLVDQDKHGNVILRVEEDELVAIEVFNKYYDLLEEAREAEKTHKKFADEVEDKISTKTDKKEDND